MRSPPPQLLAPGPLQTLTFSCSDRACRDRGSCSSARQQQEPFVLAWEHPEPLIWYPNDG